MRHSSSTRTHPPVHLYSPHPRRIKIKNDVGRALKAISDPRLRTYDPSDENPRLMAYVGPAPDKGRSRWREQWAASEPIEAWTRYISTPRWRHERPASRGRDVTYRLLARSLLLVPARDGDSERPSPRPTVVTSAREGSYANPHGSFASLAPAMRCRKLIAGMCKNHNIMRSIAHYAGRPEVVIEVKQMNLLMRILQKSGRQFDAIGRLLIEFGAPFDDAGAPVTSEGPNELHVACRKKWPKTALALIVRGANFRLVRTEFKVFMYLFHWIV